MIKGCSILSIFMEIIIQFFFPLIWYMIVIDLLILKHIFPFLEKISLGHYFFKVVLDLVY